ncbi:MAG TPA: class IV adenylate cyclase [Pyrinomonadaceae bacterium]|nr:class IV adenylate cyclase [Pyrinomonadaceae bacterium]
MAIEIEKKYRLTKRQRDAVLRRLPEIGAKLQGEEFEENTLYGGPGIELGVSVLRLRRVGGQALLTYKKRFPDSADVKRQREDETRVDDPDAANAILDGLGYRPALIYEKRRQTWVLGRSEIAIDELPFGLFMEIEGSKKNITSAEHKIGLKDLRTEHSTYPQLARKHGKRNGKLIEARFKNSVGKHSTR